MANFSLSQYSTDTPLQQWSNYIANDVFSGCIIDYDDPLFLQKISILQAERLRQITRDYGNAAVSRLDTIKENSLNSLREVRESVTTASVNLADCIDRVGGKISSNLETGFTAMNIGLSSISDNQRISNAFLESIDNGVEAMNMHMQHNTMAIGQVNRSLQGLGAINRAGFETIHKDFGQLSYALGSMKTMLEMQLITVNQRLQYILSHLEDIYNELRIPEFQRERRYYLQTGLTFLSTATSSKSDYYVDAYEEFEKALSLDRKDCLSWFYLGFIHLFAPSYLDPIKARDCFDKYLYYSSALKVGMDQWDDGCYYASLSAYLKSDIQAALSYIRGSQEKTVRSLLNEAKYLSLGDNSSKMQAKDCIAEILKISPYALMSVVQDMDVVSNPYVEEFIENARKEAIIKATSNYNSVRERILLYTKEIESYNDEINLKRKQIGNTTVRPLSIVEFTDDYSAIEELISRSTYLESVAAYERSASLSKRLDDILETAHSDYEDKIAELKSKEKSFNCESLIENCKRIDKSISSSIRLIEMAMNGHKARVSSIGELVSHFTNFYPDLKYIFDKTFIGGPEFCWMNADYDEDYIKMKSLTQGAFGLTCDKSKYYSALRCCSESTYSLLSANYEIEKKNAVEYKKKYNEIKEKQSSLEKQMNNSYLTLSERYIALDGIHIQFKSLYSSCTELIQLCEMKNRQVAGAIFNNSLQDCKSVVSLTIHFEKQLNHTNPFGMMSFSKRSQWQNDYEKDLRELRTIAEKAKRVIKTIDFAWTQRAYYVD